MPTFIPPRSDGARRFLEEIDFQRYLRGRGSDAGSQGGTLEMRQLSALDPVFVRQVADLLAERVPGVGDQASFLIELCLKELLQNVFEHAAESPGARVDSFVHARWYKQEANVRLAVVDCGIGIPGALRRHQVSGLQRHNDADVVIAAVTQDGLSSRSGRRGLGLKLIRELVTSREGSLTVLSHAAKVVFAPGGGIKKGRRTRNTAFFRGTAIEIDFRPHKTVPLPVDEVF